MKSYFFILNVDKKKYTYIYILFFSKIVISTVGQDHKKYYHDCRRLDSYKVLNYAHKFNAPWKSIFSWVKNMEFIFNNSIPLMLQYILVA